MLGTRDYVRKCGFQRVVLGLSGGIDSALTACIAVDALGRENVIGVGMPGPYSSQGSIDDSAELAKNLGIQFETVPIGDIFDTYLRSLKPVFAGRGPDVTEENIQARIRGSLMMAMSNKFGALVLTTGNKSEIGVGYCTLYGDMCGGLGRNFRCAQDAGLSPRAICELTGSGDSGFHHRETSLSGVAPRTRRTATRYRRMRCSIPFSKTMWRTISPPRQSLRSTVTIRRWSARWFTWWTKANTSGSRPRRD